MTDPSAAVTDGPPPPGGPPGWINPTIQSQMAWREDDVVVSVPGKSGTTWTMNIVHQLREHGDRNFEDIYAEVIWCEVMDKPGCTVDEMVEKLDGMDSSRPRAFKTHASPPMLPFRDNIKYVSAGVLMVDLYVYVACLHKLYLTDDVFTFNFFQLVVARNPEEAVVSMHSFINKHSDDFIEYWGAPVHMFRVPSLEAFYDGFAKQTGFVKNIFTFVAEWWQLKEKDNVLLMNYADMVKDHEGSIQKIADFLGCGPYTREEWQDILELTSFKWMKANERRFEATTVWDVPPLVRGGMMRRGSSGLARMEGLSEEMAEEIRDCGKEILTEDAFHWLYNGGTA